MNKLKHLKEFQALLASYQLSSSAAHTLMETKLMLLVAPTSSGRNTVINELMKTGEYHFIVSDTTRLPRINDGVPEQNGHEYWFRSEEEVLHDLREGDYIEAAIIHNQQVSGVSIREIEKARADSRIAITDIQIDGARNIHRAKPDALCVFVVPPSFDQWLERIHARGHMPPDELCRRLESACVEFEAALAEPFYIHMINDKLEDTVAEMHDLAKSGHQDPHKEKVARELVQRLHEQTNKYLEIMNNR